MENKKEFKARKRAYNKARRNAIRPWKGLTFLSAVIAIIMIPITVVLSVFDNTVAAFNASSNFSMKFM